MAVIIQIRRDNASTWITNNPILAQGEWGYELDTLKFKIGDGTTVWNSLPYLFDPSSQVPNNFSATTSPTANDDDNDGYEVGSSWVNTTSDDYFVCVDNTVGSAIWVNLTDKYTQQEVDDLLDNQTHVASDITDFQTAVSANTDVTNNTAHVAITNGNPHGTEIQDLVPVQASPPATPDVGDKFIRNTDYREFIYTGSKWLCTSTESYGGSRNNNNTSNSYFRLWDRLPSNESEWLVPDAITIVGLTITSRNSVSWTGEVRNNTTPIATVSTGGSDSGNLQTLSVDVASGTRLRIYYSGSGIRDPQINVYYRRRAT